MGDFWTQIRIADLHHCIHSCNPTSTTQFPELTEELSFSAAQNQMNFTVHTTTKSPCSNLAWENGEGGGEEQTGLITWMIQPKAYSTTCTSSPRGFLWGKCSYPRESNTTHKKYSGKTLMEPQTFIGTLDKSLHLECGKWAVPLSLIYWWSFGVNVPKAWPKLGAFWKMGGFPVVHSLTLRFDSNSPTLHRRMVDGSYTHTNA